MSKKLAVIMAIVMLLALVCMPAYAADHSGHTTIIITNRYAYVDQYHCQSIQWHSCLDDYASWQTRETNAHSWTVTGVSEDGARCDLRCANCGATATATLDFTPENVQSADIVASGHAGHNTIVVNTKYKYVDNCHCQTVLWHSCLDDYASWQTSETHTHDWTVTNVAEDGTRCGLKCACCGTTATATVGAKLEGAADAETPEQLNTVNSNAAVYGLFLPEDICYIAPWSESMIQNGEWSGVWDVCKVWDEDTFELMDSKTGVVCFAHSVKTIETRPAEEN